MNKREGQIDRKKDKERETDIRKGQRKTKRRQS